MWRAAASLERLDVKHKEALGEALLKPLRRSPVPTYGFWALTRLGARVLLYGPLNAVVHPRWSSAGSTPSWLSSRATRASARPGPSAWPSSPAAAASAPWTWTTAIARAC